MERHADEEARITGDELLAVLMALGSPQRLRIIARLRAGGRQYVSQLARDIGMSRPLLHMHLARLEAAGLVSSTMELSADGKATKFFEVTPFALQLTPQSIADAARTLAQDQPTASGASDAVTDDTPEEKP